jgi:hypothetical protein
MDAVKPLRFRGNDLIIFHVLDPAEDRFQFHRGGELPGPRNGEQIPVVPTALARSTSRSCRSTSPR